MFYELETWRPQSDRAAEHTALLRAWFEFVRARQAELFAEWRSARFFREVRPESGAATGRFAMLFGYVDHAGFLAYKARRRDWSGPYAAYQQVDPYPVFIPESVTTTHWRPDTAEAWPVAGLTTAASLFQVVSWRPPPDKPAAFALDGRVGRAFRSVDRETGRPQELAMLIIEHADRNAFLASGARLPEEADWADFPGREAAAPVFWQPAELERWLAW
ncbi:MAG: hypothetical protein JNK29_08745 [Anaerolineales bacterium]|nr:hypothetical protein [Anaerolineales bacterium]